MRIFVKKRKNRLSVPNSRLLPAALGAQPSDLRAVIPAY